MVDVNQPTMFLGDRKCLLYIVKKKAIGMNVKTKNTMVIFL